MESAKSFLAKIRSDDGNAPLEFITVGTLLLVPLVYLIISLALIQNSLFAATALAREAARSASIGDDSYATVNQVLSDYGIAKENTEMHIDCEPVACRPGASRTIARVRIAVRLPLVPDALSLGSIGQIQVESTASIPESVWRKP